MNKNQNDKGNQQGGRSNQTNQDGNQKKETNPNNPTANQGRTGTGAQKNQNSDATEQCLGVAQGGQRGQTTDW